MGAVLLYGIAPSHQQPSPLTRTVPTGERVSQQPCLGRSEGSMQVLKQIIPPPLN